jgi:hypothetical protein
MKVYRAVALIGLLAGPAFAQNSASNPVPTYGEADKDKTPGQIEYSKSAERAYRNSIDNVPDKGPVDPWGNARGVGEPKAAKAAAKRDAKAAAKQKGTATDAAK